MKTNSQYLGDGLYVDYDGYQIRLWTEREHGIHEVFLDRTTLGSLMNYLENKLNYRRSR